MKLANAEEIHFLKSNVGIWAKAHPMFQANSETVNAIVEFTLNEVGKTMYQSFINDEKSYDK